jgi:hypothetical protein
MTIISAPQYFTLDRYRGDTSAMRNGFRDQYPGVPRGEEARFLAFIDEMEDALEKGQELSALGQAVHNGRKEAEALPEDQRATTELIDRWMAGGHINHAGYILGRHNITHVAAQSTIVAVRHEGVLAYLWGGMPGHRFPDSAIGYTLGQWHNIIDPIKRSREFDSMSTLTRRHKFYQFVAVAKSMPVWTKLNRVFRMHGEDGLLRLFFRHKWSAAIRYPKMEYASKFAHMYIKSQYGTSAPYMLLSLEDAFEFKLRMPSEDAKQLQLIDLTAHMEHEEDHSGRYK